MLYPTSLISEISRSATTTNEETVTELQVKTYSLPFVFPSKPRKYPLGSIVIDSPNDVTAIITDCNGDMSEFGKHLALHADGMYTNLLMNLKRSDGETKGQEEVFNKDLLLQSLIPGRANFNTKKGAKMEDAATKPSLKLKRKRRKN